MAREYGVTWNTNDSVLCLLGGCLIGCTAAIRMLLFGKITGSSGLLKQVIKLSTDINDDRISAFLFCLGLVITGIISNHFLYETFDDLQHLPFVSLVFAGLLVGSGTTIGNGCTSGHGICGIARFSWRSLIATCSFMVAGIVTAIVHDTQSYYPPFENNQDWNKIHIVFWTTLVVMAILLIIGKQLQNNTNANTNTIKYFRFISEYLLGMAFAFGLVIANMTKVSATISFLDLRYWNPALAFVMMSGIGCAAITFYYIGSSNMSPNRRTSKNATTASSNDKPWLYDTFTLPTSTDIDIPLILGSVMFGAGWGLMGACPAPAITNLGSSKSGLLPFIYICFVILGMTLATIIIDYKNSISSNNNKDNKVSGGGNAQVVSTL